MADASVDKQASDLFSLGSNFKAQSSSSRTRKDVAEALDALGGITDRDESNERSEYNAVYHYVGSDLATDFTGKVGEVLNSIKSDRVLMRFRPQQAVEVEIGGHNHAQNAHVAASQSGDYGGFDLDLANLLPATHDGWDVPDGYPFANSNADATQIGLTLVFEVDHLDEVDAGGDHHVGGDSRGRVTAEIEFLDVPTLTTTGWNVDRNEPIDSNQGFDRTLVAASKALTRTTLP